MRSTQSADDEPSAARTPSLLRVFGCSFVPVAVLLVAYEVAERNWLGSVEAETLRALHLLRGLSAAAVAAALAVIVLSPRNDAPPEVGPHLAAARSWRRHLQRVSLRTKIIVPMVALAAASAMVVGALAIMRSRQALREGAVRRVEFDTASKARAVEEFLASAQQDLLFLSQIKTVRDLADAVESGPSEQVSRLRAEVEHEFQVFAQSRRAYYQVRYLDHAGHEVVRLNVEDGEPTIVPPSQLQDKSDRYYVKAGLALDLGEIYVSRVDLNLEFGKVETPPRSVVRYATRVAGAARARGGLLVINIYADYLLSLIGPLPSQTAAWLVSDEGAYLGYVGRSAEMRDRYAPQQQRRLSEDYTDEEVVSLLGREAAPPTALQTGDAFVCSAPIAFDSRVPQRRWTLIIAHPRVAIEAPIRHLTAFLSIVSALVVAVAGVIGVLVARHLARPVARLRLATRAIAAGDLARHVDITTGDEIEGLADDFNTMTDRLREAQNRLSAWNEALEQEVARKTDRLQRLQSGLARVDKLASIGQMTAAVMHEIGNPLAAIKTKIQVTQEGEDLTLPRCRPCLAMMDSILHEVNRLATFLHTFSRLARLRKPEFQTLSLGELAHGVHALVAPELKKKGVSLRLEAPAEALTICGDADQLRQLLMNLILNAEEASQGKGEILVRMRRVAHPKEANGTTDGATIEVIDQGVGMAPETMDRIWEPFFTTKSDGTGLGLGICRRIAEDHGGAIQIRSQPGQGTVVTVTFPAQVPAGSAPTRDPVQTGPCETRQPLP